MLKILEVLCDPQTYCVYLPKN